ncbi:MAG: LCP family protein [Anaerolineae bacterium]|nr:LCP family protein [Anaerolineae bacterium]
MLLLGLLGCGVGNLINPPTATPTATVTPTSTATLTPTPPLTPTPTERPILCGGPPAMFILLIGSDARAKSYAAGLADSIRLVRVDFIEARIQLLPFPRDLYVEIPGIESHGGITHGKLNQAYLYGNPGFGYYDGEGQGPGLLARTLEHNFGAQVDHYVVVNLQSFARIVDALDGINVNLPSVVDGRVKGSRDRNLYFPAGKQHLNGYRTMLLARMRPLGDFQRSGVQNLILQALAVKLFSPSVVPKLPELMEAFNGSVQTDLGPVEAGQLLCLAAMLDTQKIEFVSFPETLFKSGRVQDPVLGNTSILEVDFNILRIHTQNFKDGAALEPEEGLLDGIQQ